MTSANQVARGFLVFIRKIANKLVEMQKANEEIASFLESIPEWGEYFEKELSKVNETEKKPLGQDNEKQRKKSEDQNNEDEVFVMNFLNRFNRSQHEKEDKKKKLFGGNGVSNDNEDEDDDEDNEELKHSDSFERSGRVDPDEDLLEVGTYEEHMMIE